MTNIINITEKNNRLEFSDSYTPIVCGNSNYVLKFSFSEQWQKCNKKAAIFIVDGNKLTVDFNGDECQVPVMPNASFVQVSLVSGDGEIELATTSLKIRLEPTVASGDFSEYNQLTNYLPKVLGAINKIESGDVIAKNAENSNNSENAKNAEFATNSSYSERANVASSAQNVSNSNLLINGDFRINQRGLTTYVDNNKYTVDRWQLLYGSLTVNSDGPITHTSTNNWQGLRQYIEFPSRYAGKTLTFSMKANSTSTRLAQINLLKNGQTSATTLANSGTIQAGESVNSFSLTLPEDITDNDKLYVLLYTPLANESVIYYWTKLEVGNTSTEFIPRLYAEELALCQRFYQRFSHKKSETVEALIGMFIAANATAGFGLIDFLIPMRNTPSITYINLKVGFSSATLSSTTITRIQYNSIDTCYQKYKLYLEGSGFASGQCYYLAIGNNGYIDFDAEIY